MKNRRTIDPSVKLEVVRMIKEQGLSVPHVSQSVGFSQAVNIRAWVHTTVCCALAIRYFWK